MDKETARPGMPLPGADEAAAAAASGSAALAAMTDRMMQGNRQLAEVAAAIAREMLDFTGRRMQAQLDFITSLQRASDVNGVMEAQMRFVERATRDYAEEIEQVSGVMRRAGGPGGAAG